MESSRNETRLTAIVHPQHKQHYALIILLSMCCPNSGALCAWFNNQQKKTQENECIIGSVKFDGYSRYFMLLSDIFKVRITLQAKRCKNSANFMISTIELVE